MTDPHPPSSEAASTSLARAADALHVGERTSRQLTDLLLERIGEVDTAATTTGLRAVLAIAPDAHEVATLCDGVQRAGRPMGPLHGVPMLVKDNIESVGLPATAGSAALLGRTVTRDSPVAARLRAAGAVIIGSTNLSEWANFRSPHSTSGWSAVGGLTGNPWALDRSAGGSSSGSGAAVAAGLAFAAIGTETNGSITCPAALNGVVGLKPTVGSVPSQGIVPVSLSQDVAGPLARTVLDAAIVYEVISGRGDCRVACTPESAATLRAGVVEAWLTGHAATDALFERAVAAVTPLLASVRSTPVPITPGDVYVDQVDVLLGEVRDDLDAYLSARPGSGVRNLADVVAFNAEHADVELSGFGQEYFERALEAGGRAGARYQAARAANVAFARDACLGPALADADVLLAPAYQPAWKSDLTLGDILDGGGAVCTPAAILGWPILTVPMGVVDGLPVGLSLVGGAGSEPLLLAVGAALEASLGLAASGSLRPLWQPPTRG